MPKQMLGPDKDQNSKNPHKSHCKTYKIVLRDSLILHSFILSDFLLRFPISSQTQFPTS